MLRLRFLPFYDKLGFISEMAGLRFDFYMPFNGSSGPLGFYVPLYAILLGFGACGLLLLAGVLARRHSDGLSRAFFACFVGVGISFSLFICLAFVMGISGPNINSVYTEALTYVNGHLVGTPLYVFRNPAVIFYLNESYLTHIDHSFSFDYTNLKSYDMAAFSKNFSDYTDGWILYRDIVFLNEKSQADAIGNGTVMMIDFPYFGYQLPVWKRLKDCDELTRFSSNGFDVGYIFKCSTG
jgi:hypothetical protein